MNILMAAVFLALKRQRFIFKGDKMTTITLTRALAELKLYDKKIQKKIDNACFINFKVGEKLEDPNCQPESDYQSITDLIKYRDKLKSAIMKANATTLVSINGEQLTIAEAIEKKNSIRYLRSLLHKMRRDREHTRETIRVINEEVQARLDRLLEANFGSNGKIREEDIKKVSEPFLEANEAKEIDPIEIDKKIEELENYIDSFESEVDLALSEINAKTEITI